MGRGKGKCLWCACAKAWHTGSVPEAIRADPEFRNVKWSKSACSNPGCRGCRRYES